VIRLVSNGKLQGKPFLDVSPLISTSSADQGPLSMAFSPRYAQDRLFYVDYTDTNGNIRVEECRANGKHSPQHTRSLLLVQHPTYKITRAGSSSSGRTDGSTSASATVGVPAIRTTTVRTSRGAWPSSSPRTPPT
jgi:hypothetical protein